MRGRESEREGEKKYRTDNQIADSHTHNKSVATSSSVKRQKARLENHTERCLAKAERATATATEQATSINYSKSASAPAGQHASIGPRPASGIRNPGSRCHREPALRTQAKPSLDWQVAYITASPRPHSQPAVPRVPYLWQPGPATSRSLVLVQQQGWRPAWL